MKDPYVYENTNILKNKLGIKNQDMLDKFENDIVNTKLINVDKYNIKEFNFENLQEFHKYLFGDVYDFAGEPRKINMYKGERVLLGDSVRYADHNEIENKANIFFKELKNIKWKDLNLSEKAEAFTKETAKIWQVHPFREGNTRTTVTFMSKYAECNGFKLDRDLISENSKYVRDSLVLASIGEYSEYEHLERIFKDSIERGHIDTKIKDLQDKHIKGDFNSKHLAKINNYLTNEMEGYGEFNVAAIDELNDTVFQDLKENKFLKGMDHTQVSEKLAEYFMKIDDTKPFMKGNIATAKVFIKELAAKNGFELDIEELPNKFTEMSEVSKTIESAFTNIEPSKNLMKNMDFGMDFDR